MIRASVLPGFKAAPPFVFRPAFPKSVLPRPLRLSYLAEPANKPVHPSIRCRRH